KIKGPVLVLEEAVSPVVAALDDVNRNSRKHDPRASGHAQVNGPARPPLTEKRGLSLISF
ncbi:MAG TPA: hypothetical protein VFZ81_14430, partial [Burkholderiales bacterium]